MPEPTNLAIDLTAVYAMRKKLGPAGAGAGIQPPTTTPASPAAGSRVFSAPAAYFCR